jgi:hypothetical protein
LKPPLDKLVNCLYIYWGWPRRPRSSGCSGIKMELLFISKFLGTICQRLRYAYLVH